MPALGWTVLASLLAASAGDLVVDSRVGEELTSSWSLWKRIEKAASSDDPEASQKLAADLIKLAIAHGHDESDVLSVSRRLTKKEAIHPDVEQTVGKMITSIGVSLLPSFSTHHGDMQREIDTAVQQLADASEAAVSLQRQAADIDSSWVACTAQERNLLMATEECQGTLAAKRAQRDADCSKSRTYQLTVPAQLQSLQCDFVLDSCTELFSVWKQQMETWVDDQVSPNVDAALVVMREVADNCTANSWASEAMEAQCNDASGAWFKQQGRCQEYQAAQQVAICAFETKFQAKCAAKNAFESLTGRLDQSRSKKIHTAKVVRCMLQEYIDAADFENETLHACHDETSNDPNVTRVLDTKAELFALLTSPENFTCLEPSITFNGSRWSRPSHSSPSSSWVFDASYSEPVTRHHHVPSLSVCQLT